MSNFENRLQNYNLLTTIAHFDTNFSEDPTNRNCSCLYAKFFISNLKKFNQKYPRIDYTPYLYTFFDDLLRQNRINLIGNNLALYVI
jgi:hypothetical protein